MNFEELREGDSVMVVRRVATREGDWDNSWTPEMDGAIGRVFVISSYSRKGVRFEGSGEHGFWQGFPWEACRPAYVDAATSLLDSSLMGASLRDCSEIRPGYAYGASYGANAEYQRQLYEAGAATTAQERFANWKWRRTERVRMFRRRMQENLLDVRRYRYERVQRAKLAATMQFNATQGALLAEYVLAHRRGIPTAPEASKRLAEGLTKLAALAAEEGGLGYDESTIMNMLCQVSYARISHTHTVNVRWCNVGQHFTSAVTRRTDTWGQCVCTDCLSTGAWVWSRAMDCYIPRDRAYPLYTSGSSWDNEDPDYVTSSRGDSDYYEDEDGNYMTADVYDYVYGEYPDGYHTYDEDEDEDEDDGLSGYHSAYRDFSERASDPAYPALGVELEVWAADRRDAARACRALDHITERDGSLCDYHGFEIVTRPFGKTEWADEAKKLMEVCEREDIQGYNAENGMYGIHVNIHRRHLSPLQEARIFMFLTAVENKSFMQAIAQRAACYGSPRLDMGGLDANQPRPKYFGSLTEHCQYDAHKEEYVTKRKIVGLGKYSPVNWKANVAEFRMFQSTTYLPSFMKNLEFIWALVEWTKPVTASGSAWHHTQFVSWLAKRPDAKKDYPNLLAYLARESFGIKGQRERVQNTWCHLLTPKQKPGLDDAQSEATSSEVELAVAA